ncbi:VOC family protein [Hydrogenophaga sp. BPS33]|uniref:VOC family protein n=1 Tax=Hydrogenophaga sp. BPS33 TaxID=2651974 RepID=UPI00131F8BDC|nr:VOC family protein [Hydrogenophaga sp. BPS33]QHE88216.1 VOC family protein [Hydrogenophaga sp. BPS33]
MADARARLDHLVVAARTLDEGVVWCETTLGVTPGLGGAHPLFGTHNRLIKLDGSGSPASYLEIIAIHPKATPTRAAHQRRWFDLDDPAMKARLVQHGPQLVHWVASVPNIGHAVASLRAIGIQRGPAVSASRQTPQGLLQWHISVRDDGQRLYNGALPTLIQWVGAHPTTHMPHSGVSLRRLRLHHAGAAGLRAALQALELDGGPSVCDGPAGITAELETPSRGRVTLLSPP